MTCLEQPEELIPKQVAQRVLCLPLASPAIGKSCNGKLGLLVRVAGTPGYLHKIIVPLRLYASVPLCKCKNTFKT
jgi:hypothetical protein